MSDKAKKKRLPKVYYTAPNGIKIELKGFGFAADYVEDKLRTELAIALQVPKDILFPYKKLVGVTVHEPRLNVALTDELNTKGSVEVTFKYGEVSK